MGLQTLSCVVFFAVIGVAVASAGPLCQEDSATIDTGIVDEASGLALAQGGGYFLMNDSGDKPRFFRVNGKGRELIEFVISGWKPFDPEAIRVGPCPTVMAGQCLAVADIGDNRERRKFVEIAFFSIERLRRAGTLKPDRILRFHYPDGSHNAEGFGILSNSRLLVVTKEQDRKSRKAKSARVYSVELSGTGTALQAATAKFQIELNVPEWVKDHGLGGLVTDVDVDASSQERTRLLLLTYSQVVEVAANWTLGRLTLENKRIYRVDSLEQQEAISYDDEKRGFYFTSEAPLAALNWLRAGDKARMPIRYFRPDACGDRVQ